MAMMGPTTNHKEIRGWAERHQTVPVEDLPEIVDHIPASVRLVHRIDLKPGGHLKQIAWDDFFARFDLLGLAFVYDDDATGYNELLQIEGKSPFRNKEYKAFASDN